MSEVIEGVIDSIYNKQVTTKFGPKAVYHAMVNGHDVNLGFKTNHVEGETVRLNVEHKYGGYQLIQGNGAGSTATPRPSQQDTPAAAAPPATRSKGPAFPVDTNTKDISIIRQSSLNRAMEAMDILMASEIIAPKTVEEFNKQVLAIAYEYADFGSGQREVKQAAAIAGYEE
jgi:hypothetical protein